MQSHYDFTDGEFNEAFERITLDPKLFNHEAHLRLAWIHIREHGVEKAVVNVTQQLKNYATALSFAANYHHTLTEAAVRAVNHFMSKSKAGSFKVFIAENPRLKYNLKELLKQHYLIDIFKSEPAKSRYLEPDLRPF